MDREVAKTLSELELKLQELERELTSIARRDIQAATTRPAGTLVDEAVERQQQSYAGEQSSARESARLEGDGFGGPAVFGGEEVPAQAGATVERDWTVETRETAYGEIPTPPSPPAPPVASTSPPPSYPPEPSQPATPPGAPPHTPPRIYPRSSPPGASPPAQPPRALPPSAPPGIHVPASPPGSNPPVQPPRALPPSAPPGMHIPSSPPGWSPPPDPRRPGAVEESRSIDLAELVRFRDKLVHTMDDLIDEYDRLLRAEPPAGRRPGV